MISYTLIDLFRRTNVVTEFYSIKNEISKGRDYAQNCQRTKLSGLLKNISTHPFYSKYILGYDEKVIESDPYKVLKSIPVISKAQILNYGNWYMGDDRDRDYENRFSSGSTGTPFNYYLSKKSISRLVAFNYYLWAYFLGYKLGDRILSIVGGTNKYNLTFKNKIYFFLQGKYLFPGNSVNENELLICLNSLINLKYEVIYAYPSLLEYYVDEAIKRNMKIKHKIKGVITNAEILNESVRNKLSDFFNCPVLNCYGARDGGVMAAERKDVDKGFYFNSFDCIVESLTVNNVIGEHELICTNLNNSSFPFVRYRVGDLGTVENYDSSGVLPLQKITKIDGRTCDLVYTKSGGAFHGAALNIILKATDGINSYQIVQNADYNLEVRIKSEKNAVCVQSIKNVLQNLIKDPGLEIQVLLNQDFIKSGKNQKFKLIISNVKKDCKL